MIIEKPSVDLINAPTQGMLYATIEAAGRTCYKSENLIAQHSAEKFIRNIIQRSHLAVLEHGAITARFVCDRGVTHEIVRHRLASYCQESTRYCNYSKEKFGSSITVIEPLYLIQGTMPFETWRRSMEEAERAYFELMNFGCTPQEARAVLPNSLKTEIVMTANPREWRHFFTLRCAAAAHPQMREVAKMAYRLMLNRYPALFEDLEVPDV